MQESLRNTNQVRDILRTLVVIFQMIVTQVLGEKLRK
jgi:hypothetical protein